MQTGPRGQSRSLPRTLQLVGGGLLTLAGMSGTLIYPLTFGTLFLLALWYSPDHHLEPLTALRLAVLVFYLGFIALNAGTLILACLDRSLRQRLGRVLWTDAGCPESSGWRALPWLLLPTAVALLLIISWVVARWVQWYPLVLQYREDGPFEGSTAAALVLAAVVLAWAAFSLWRMAAAQSGSAYRWSFWVCIGLMAAAFVVGMEESGFSDGRPRQPSANSTTRTRPTCTTCSIRSRTSCTSCQRLSSSRSSRASGCGSGGPRARSIGRSCPIPASSS